MRKLDRSAIKRPPSLTVPDADVGNEKIQAAAYYGARVPWQASHTSFDFKKYRAPDVKAALRKLAGGNCAYCESKINASGAREVEHYRPKGDISGLSGHPGYWWLAHDWENLLPTCRDCNKSLKQHIVTPGMTTSEVEDLLAQKPKDVYGKGTQFAIQGTRAVGDKCVLDDEDPLLIDPCRRDPANELRWDFSTELTLIEPILGKYGPSPYGTYTIRTCALNRAELVLERIPVLNLMRSSRLRLINKLNLWDGTQKQLAEIIDDATALGEYAQPNQPYSGMAAAFIKDFENELEAWRIRQGLPPF